MTPSLNSAIEHLYTTFGKYPLIDLYYCDCGCTDEADVKKLSSKPLRELTEDDLAYYQGSAMYTIGGLEHYKHFLPRICELTSLDRVCCMINLDEIHMKLAYANWTKWDVQEVQAIKDFVLWDWVDRVNHEKGEINEFILSAYHHFLGLEELTKLWDISDSAAALRNFVFFFYHFGNQILNKGLMVNEKKAQDAFISMIRVEGLVEKLEEAFFAYETADSEYAEKASVVLQMMEQFMILD